MFDPFPLVSRYPDNGEAMPLIYCSEAKCFACADEDDPRWTKDHESGEWWCPRHAVELAWIACGCGFKTQFTGDPADTLTNGLCRSCARYGRVVKQRELEDLHRLEAHSKYPFLLR